jgi:4-hydroxy-3-methylbut-2-en-1-yl diphosphate reductase
MNVTIDPGSGFCFGVDHAVRAAEQTLLITETLYCLGDIVHNNREVARLTQRGLRIIDREEFKELRNCKVMIRAHGEPPETYNIAKENNIELIDATCPVVLKLQKRIKSASLAMDEKNGQVVIYGKEGHAEVNGLVGQTSGNAVIVGGEEELDKIDFSRPVRLFSQTTMGSDGFQKIKERIQERMSASSQSGVPDLEVVDSVCRQVSNRSVDLQQFSARFDVIIFVSGKTSSNGKYLYEVCRNANQNAYFVSGKEELEREWFVNKESVGVCGATSTPEWLMQEVKDEILRFGE